MPIITLDADLKPNDFQVRTRSGNLAQLYPKAMTQEGRDLEEIKDSEFDYASTNEELLMGQTNNSFLNAVLHAYNTHTGLTLSPDIILQLVTTTVAKCVNDFSEEYRDVFVNFAGKKRLTVEITPQECASPDRWKISIGRINDAIEQNIRTSLDMLPSFTTTTLVARTSAQLTKMAVFKNYFSYRVVCLCGIKEVNLKGTLEDWQLLHAKITQLQSIITTKNHLVNWFKHILTIVDNLIETYKNNITPELKLFWQRIVDYVPYGSGRGKLISGWVKLLIPGSTYDNIPLHLNLLDPTSSLPNSEDYDYYKFQNVHRDWSQLTFDSTPSVSYVEAELLINTTKYNVYFTTGVLGYKVEGDFAEPVISYVVHTKLVA
jgi:hypothetical protein